MAHITIKNVTQLCFLLVSSLREVPGRLCSLTKGIEHRVQVTESVAALEQELDRSIGTTNSLGDLVNVLGLDDGLQVILQKLGEVV